MKQLRQRSLQMITVWLIIIVTTLCYTVLSDEIKSNTFNKLDYKPLKKYSTTNHHQLNSQLSHQQQDSLFD